MITLREGVKHKKSREVSPNDIMIDIKPHGTVVYLAQKVTDNKMTLHC